jgi:hypothetical protein
MLKLTKLLRNDDGNVLVVVVMVAMLIGALAALTLATGQQADWASAKDRNHEVALGVTEAAVHEAVARIESRVATNQSFTNFNVTGDTDEGDYQATVTRVGEAFVVDALGTVGPGQLTRRKRHVKVTLLPPEMFPDAGYALFSKTNLYLKNNNEVYDGDVWANDSLWAESGARIEGSVTSAQSWIKLENGSTVTGYLWAGGRRCDIEGQNPCQSGWGINVAPISDIGGWIKSSVSAPNCDGENIDAYKVVLDARTVGGDVTSFGPKTGSTSIPPERLHRDCTTAQPRKDPPVFTFNRWNYDQSTYREFSSAADFNNALTNNLQGINKTALVGTFVITECGTGTVNLTGSEIAGNVTVITNPQPCENGVKGARIRTESVGDNGVPAGSRAEFVLVSHYEPPPGTSCTDKDDTYCAISALNHFDSTCKTATLVYADNGPVSMKNDVGPNDNQMCGSIIANGIHMKNDLKLTYDPLFDRVLGFGPRVYEIARWEELPVS